MFNRPDIRKKNLLKRVPLRVYLIIDAIYQIRQGPLSIFTSIQSVRVLESFNLFIYRKIPSNRRDNLYNDFLQTCKDTFKVAFRRQQQDIGSKIINTLVDTLWFIDPFLEKLKERSCKIPDKLYFSGYRDLKKSHKKYVGVQVNLHSF